VLHELRSAGDNKLPAFALFILEVEDRHIKTWRG
jgi:hypothetical protein